MKPFSGPRKGRNPKTDVSVLEYFKDLQKKGLPVTREALTSKAKECARNSNICFKAKCARLFKVYEERKLIITTSFRIQN
jgi:hypothetical protein